MFVYIDLSGRRESSCVWIHSRGAGGEWWTVVVSGGELCRVVDSGGGVW